MKLENIISLLSNYTPLTKINVRFHNNLSHKKNSVEYLTDLYYELQNKLEHVSYKTVEI